jgi:histidinol-phosphate aminotransferase
MKTFENGVNRYRIHRLALKRISSTTKISPNQILLGNGSDEVLDLLSEPFANQVRIITLPPTYGMYGVLANINNVENKEVLLSTDFEPQVDAILDAVTENKKCSFVLS